MRLGDLVKDRVTGFEGVAMCRAEWLNRCVRIQIQPRKLKDGKVLDADSFDVDQIEVIKEEVFQGSAGLHKLHGFELGDLVRDKITSFEGIIECIDKWLNGNVRAVIQPRKLKDGKVVKSEYLDMGRLDLITKGVFKPKTIDTGGPMPKPQEF